MAADLDGLYRRDFYAWALNQAGELRRLAETHPNTALDFPNLIDEIEGLANNDLNAVLSQLERLIQHLLKLEHSPSPYPRRQWLISVNNARREVRRRLTGAMRPLVEAELVDLYRFARENARLELLDHGEREAADALLSHNSYPLDRLLDETWYPANRHGLVDEV